jgi:hypothetical protein
MHNIMTYLYLEFMLQFGPLEVAVPLGFFEADGAYKAYMF